MEIYCVKCGEPWDNDSLHEIAYELDSTYAAMAKEFRERGCNLFGEAEWCTSNGDRESREAIYDLLGDDMDAASSMIEDFSLN